MSRWMPWRVILISLLHLGFGALAQPDRPNIIIILADDLGYGDLGCYGQKRIRTPRLDRMASEGIRFTHFYAGATVCAPSRCALMQGLHTGHCRVRGNAGRQNPLAQALRSDDRTISRALHDDGYVTGLIGKWGLGDVGPAESGLPRRQGFDSFFGYLNQQHAHNYFPSFLWRDDEQVILPNVVPNSEPSGAGVSSNKVQYSPDLIVSEALSFMRRNRSRPFFLLFTPTLPHANNEAGPRGMEIPELGEYAAMEWPEPQKAHAAMVGRLDRDAGRILDELETLGLTSRTIVFFTSDNGPHREGGNDPEFNDSNGPLRGIKRDLYEGGIRVPLIVRCPGHIPPGRSVDTVGWFPDFFPTLLALARIPTSGGFDGIDLSPILFHKGHPRPRPEPFYWEFHENGFKQAVLDGRWKGVRPSSSAALELYDLQSDPAESRDVAKEFPTEAGRLSDWLARLRMDSPDWPIQPGRTNAGAQSHQPVPRGR